MGGMIKQPSPCPRAGALSQLMIASVNYCHCARHGGMGAAAVHRREAKASRGWLRGGDPRLEEEHVLRQKLINTNNRASEKLTEGQGGCGWHTENISFQLVFKLDAQGWPGFKPGVALKEITPTPFSASTADAKPA